MRDYKRVRFRTGRYVHWAYEGFGKFPTLCSRVMPWHEGEFCDWPVTCRTCLDIRPDEATSKASSTSVGGDSLP